MYYCSPVKTVTDRGEVKSKLLIVAPAGEDVKKTTNTLYIVCRLRVKTLNKDPSAFSACILQAMDSAIYRTLVNCISAQNITYAVKEKNLDK